MTNIISIDPSKNSIGIYVRQEIGEEMIGTIVNDFKTERESILNIENKLAEYLDLYNISICLIEDYPYHMKNSKSLTILAEIKGLIKFLVLKRNIKIIYIPISIWKSFSKITEKKKDTKKAKNNYINQAKLNYKKDFKSTDEVDAFLMFYTVCMLKKGIIKSNSQLNLRKQIDKYL